MKPPQMHPEQHLDQDQHHNKFNHNKFNRSKFNRSTFNRMDGLSTAKLAGATVLSVAVLALVNNVLNVFYTRSGFPVPYAEGQTSFDGAQVKRWYAVMSNAGTLRIYVGTQLFDYVFMVAVAVTGILIGSLIVRLAQGEGRTRHQLRRLGRLIRIVVPIGSLFDATENLFSFVMLSQPSTFWNGWAVLQSTAAVIKFALIATGMLGTLACAVGLVAISITHRVAQSPSST